LFYELTDHFVVKADVEKTWSFFSDAGNLPDITPPWLHFRLVTPQPIDIKQDARIDYTICWAGLPVKWRTRIIDWTPPRQFIDLQIRGPYVLWHHQHTFTPVEDGTACTDRVTYRLPMPGIDRLVHRFLVRKQLLEIFRFRRKVISDRLGWVRAVQNDVEVRELT